MKLSGDDPNPKEELLNNDQSEIDMINILPRLFLGFSAFMNIIFWNELIIHNEHTKGGADEGRFYRGHSSWITILLVRIKYF